SARLCLLLGKAALEEQGEPGCDLLVELGDAANRGVVFAYGRRILVRIEIEGVGDVQRIDEQVIAALHIDQKVRRKDVELPARCQTWRLDAEIAERSGKRGPQPITRRRGLTTWIERVAQRDLEPLPDALENRIDPDCPKLFAGRPGLGIGVERGPATAGERK